MDFYKGKVAKQFIVQILLFSMLITVFLTALQLYIDYINGLEDIHKNAAIIENSYLELVSNAVWNFDDEILKVQLDGLAKLPDIQYVEILYNNDQQIIRGNRLDRDQITEVFPLTHYVKGELIELGSMTVQFSLQGLYQRLLDTAVVIVISQSIKTFLVSFFIFFIFYRLVGRYLGSISTYAKNLNETTLATGLVLKKKKDSKIRDEIDLLADSLNEMRRSFIDYKQRTEISQRDLEYIATHDAMTDLPNRVLLNDRADQMIAEAEREHKNVAFLYLDLDTFKQINDVYGHEIGDQVLIHVSKVLRATLRKSDTLARISSDEFVVLIHYKDDENVVTRFARKLSDAVSEPFKINNIHLTVNLCIGISVYPSDEVSADILLRNADTAMYKAKQSGSAHIEYYRPEFTQLAEKLIQLEKEIDQAIKNEEFVVYFQPQIDIEQQVMVGAEALVRWHSPTKGLISPVDFIPFAEQSGQISDIDQWVFKKVALLIVAYERLGIHLPKISVNFSSREFDHCPLSEIIKDILSSTKCPPSRVAVELTESALMDDPVKCAKELNNIQSMGISIAVDDFGTGYSSLSYLKNLPISKLKIDQAFVRDLSGDANDQAIVKAIIALGQSLNMELIAEGVETKEQQQFLIDAGCHEVQGYLYSKPLMEKGFIQFLNDYP